MHNIGLLDFETVLLFFQNWNEDDPIKSNAHVFFSFLEYLSMCEHLVTARRRM